MYERTPCLWIHDLIFGCFAMARIVPMFPRPQQRFHADLASRCAHGITILPASAVKHSVAIGIACDIVTRYRCLKLVSLSVNKFGGSRRQLQIFRLKKLRPGKETRSLH